MTKEEQRIAIAEKCGVKPKEVWTACGQLCNCDPQEGHWITQDVPNYPEDLNAMNEAEQVIGWSFRYMATLSCVTGQKPWGFANAAQRSEAFCRTLWPEKWVEK